MKKIAIILLLCCSQSSFSALPPAFQNTKDLDVMLRFIKSHPKVLSTLQSIDFKHKNVYFGAKHLLVERHVANR